MRLDDPRDLPRIASHLKSDAISRAQAPGEQLERRRRGLDPPRRTHLARLDDRHLAEIAVDIQPNAPHPFSFLASDAGEPVGKRHRRIRAHGTTGQVAAAATDLSGSKPIAQNRPAQPAFSQRAPVPVSRTYDRPRTTAHSTPQFHDPISDS
jgi:hypothetical protein